MSDELLENPPSRKNLFGEIKNPVYGFNKHKTETFFTQNRLRLLLIITFSILFYVLIAINTDHCAFTTAGIVSSGKSSAETCKWVFHHYSSSPWEKYWADNISTLQNNVCSTLMGDEHFHKSLITLQYIIESQKSIAKKSFSSVKYDRLLSKMYYQYNCLDSRKSEPLVSQYIEPLIGLLRDPLTICATPRLPPSLALDFEEAALSKRFFLLGPSAAFQHYSKPIPSIVPWLSPTPTSQKILFDLGASYFLGTSNATITTSEVIGTRWFYKYFTSHSLHLDRIIAFEASAYSPRTYWQQIPDDIIGKLTFINTAVENTGKFNPWNILKTIAKVDDYVIIKLDIDTSELESELVNQIINDRSISSLIDEMFFEMHVTVNEMIGLWGSPPGELKDTYLLFTKLRQLGIRMHSWP